SGSWVRLIEWENFRRLQKNRVKTSYLLMERCPRKLNLGEAKVGFAPYRLYPFFRRLAPWPCGSVAGAPITRSLLIRRKNIAVRTYSKWYGGTVRRCAAIVPNTSPPTWIQ